jgi:hypothetical protein
MRSFADAYRLNPLRTASPDQSRLAGRASIRQWGRFSVSNTSVLLSPNYNPTEKQHSSHDNQGANAGDGVACRSYRVDVAHADCEHDGSNYPDGYLNERGATEVNSWMEMIEHPEKE